jgi:hypothetical protein
MSVVLKEAARVDRKGRLSLGSDLEGKLFRVVLDDNGNIVLTPIATIPERELWLHRNPEALAAVQQGLREAAAGLVTDLGSFSRYVDAEDE